MPTKQQRYIAVVRLSDRADTTIAEPGEIVPELVIKRSPWLVEQGLVAPAPPEQEVTGGI